MQKRHHKHRNNSVARCYFYSDSYFAWYFWNTICVTLTTIRWPDVVMTYRQKRAFQLLFLSFFSASRLACLCVALSTAYILNAFFAYFQFAFVILTRCLQGIKIFKCPRFLRMSSRRAIFLKHLSLPKIWVIDNNVWWRLMPVSPNAEMTRYIFVFENIKISR